MKRTRPDALGLFGTLFLKRHSEEGFIAFYPIDDEVTIGSDSKCSIRLYYDDIEDVHCKILVHDKRAFLSVLGSSGVKLNGHQVLPNTEDPPLLLDDTTEINIRNKCFVYSFLDEEFIDDEHFTPKRKPRLSMIERAEVFTPRPSSDPKVNLKILRSPVKGRISSSPVKYGGKPGGIILVDGFHPKLLEDEKDLIIAEDLHPLQSAPAPPDPPQNTPPRRPKERATLHKAALMRCTQQFRTRLEEEAEENEVAAYVSGPISSSSSEADNDSDEEKQETNETDDVGGLRKTMKGLRKSLEAVVTWPFQPSLTAREGSDMENKDTETQAHSDGSDEEDEEKSPQDEVTANEPATPRSRVRAESELGTPIHRPVTPTPPRGMLPLGQFMTPQYPARAHAIAKGRHSLGGIMEGPQRVTTETKWRVKDLLDPVREEGGEQEKPEVEAPQTPLTNRTTKLTTELERQAIKERRRSALRTPDAFFDGKAPGLSPSLRRDSNIFSPHLPRPDADDDSNEETSALLERMKETLEGMRRRGSMLANEGAGGEGSPGSKRMKLTERMCLSPMKRKEEWSRAIELVKAREVQGGDSSTEDSHSPTTSSSSGQSQTVVEPGSVDDKSAAVAQEAPVMPKGETRGTEEYPVNDALPGKARLLRSKKPVVEEAVVPVRTQPKASRVKKEPVESGSTQTKARSTAAKSKSTQPDADEGQAPVRRGRKVIAEAEISEDKATSTKPTKRARAPKSALPAPADNTEDVEAEQTEHNEPRPKPSRRTRTPKPEVLPEETNEMERPRGPGRKVRAKTIEGTANTVPSGLQTNQAEVIEESPKGTVDAAKIDGGASKPAKKSRARAAKEPVKGNESQVVEGASTKTPASTKATKATRATRATKEAGTTPGSSEDAIKDNAPRAQSPLVVQEHESEKVVKKGVVRMKNAIPAKTEIAEDELTTTRTRRLRTRTGKA